MANIKIVYDGLEQQVSTLANLIQTYEGLNARALSLQERVASSWQGEAAKAYINKLTSYINEANKMTSVIEAFKGYANNSSVKFKELDQSCAIRIRNSF